MPKDKESKRLAEIQNVSEDECYERWEGVYWEPYENGSDTGICQSNFDFDGWAAEYEQKENESDEG